MADVWRLTNSGFPGAMGPAYERLLSALGSDDFGATVRGCVDTVTAGATRIYLFEAMAPDDDTLRYCHCEPRIAGLLEAYAQHYKRLDPLRDLYGSAQRVGQMAMQRVRPADISSPAFRHRFFDQAGIVERVSIVQRGADHWRGMNIARHAREGSFSDRELDNLADLARLALPMLSRARSRIPAGATLSAAQLEERFVGRCARLTRRERQVCARAAMGMSVEATAIELGIAKTSVLTFRQRAYRRLGVTSPFELLGLVAC